MFSTAEPLTHALVGAQFGDLEFDVGKSVRWTQYYMDTVFITDVNLGTQRYWVVNWAASFPEAKSAVTGVNFFVDRVGFRKAQYAAAKKAWTFDSTDWVLFMDAHEGMSVDTRPPAPTDWAIEPFRSYLYREVQRAIDAGRDRSVIPFFVFLRHDHLQNIEYLSPSPPSSGTGEFGGSTPPPMQVQQSVGVPYYLPYQGLTRLVQVSALDNPAFDWNIIDTPSAASAGVKVQIVSYGYAHWNMQDVIPPATEPEPLSEANDDGWRQRLLLSQVRPITGLPHAAYQPPASDPVGEPGPWCLDITVPPDLGTPPAVSIPPPAPTANTQPILTPLYDQVFRVNLRDGVWYDEGQLGNVPLIWNEATQTWDPVVAPADWQAGNYAVS